MMLTNTHKTLLIVGAVFLSFTFIISVAVVVKKSEPATKYSLLEKCMWASETRSSQFCMELVQNFKKKDID